mgnify:CR=1 FL=1
MGGCLVTVLVVGAGPTGLLLAAELQRRGVDCLLVDEHERPLEWDRATVVHPRSLEIFESLGILEPLLDAGVKQRRAQLHSNGAVLGDIDLSLSGSRFPFNIGISEEVTERLLTDYLGRQGGTVTRATRLVGLEEVEGGVRATLLRDGAQSDIVADWVVGCDGYHSTVRTLAGIAEDGHDIAEPWAVFDATLPDWPQSFEANYAYLDRTAVILTSLPGKRWRVYLRPSSATSDLAADALATLSRYLPAVRFEAIANPRRFQCHAKVARQYRSGRILLAGDAAHACSPAQGHGMNSGLQDAHNLAWKLALVCLGQADARLLDSYEAERRPVAARIVAEGEDAERVQIVPNDEDRRARDDAMRTALADPASKHHEAVAEAELDIDYAASPIVMGERADALWPGQRLPDWIECHAGPDAAGLLHRHADRRGHTAFLIGGTAEAGTQLQEVRRALELPEGGVVEALMTLAVDPEASDVDARLPPVIAERLGLDAITLLVIRPDGHVGLRATANHAAALAAYAGLVRSGRVSAAP